MRPIAIKALIVLLLGWNALLSARSVIMQRRLAQLERFAVAMKLDHERKLSLAMEASANAFHAATNQKITPPMRPRKVRP